jgi:hypothetical protein
MENAQQEEALHIARSTTWPKGCGGKKSGVTRRRRAGTPATP